jgi:hypothetical protein
MSGLRSAGRRVVVWDIGERLSGQNQNLPSVYGRTICALPSTGLRLWIKVSMGTPADRTIPTAHSTACLSSPLRRDDRIQIWIALAPKFLASAPRPAYESLSEEAITAA